MLMHLLVNIPPVESLEQMSGYVKFMKDLVIKKTYVRLNFTNDVHHYSATATKSLVQKMEDPSGFTTSSQLGQSTL